MNYTYDGVGNRTAANGELSTYNSRNEQLTQGSTQFEHDPNGQRTKCCWGVTPARINVDNEACVVW